MNKQKDTNGYFSTILTVNRPHTFFYELPFVLEEFENDLDIHISVDGGGEIVIEYPDGTESNHLPTSQYQGDRDSEITDWSIDSYQYLFRKKGSSNV